MMYASYDVQSFSYTKEMRHSSGVKKDKRVESSNPTVQQSNSPTVQQKGSLFTLAFIRFRLMPGRRDVLLRLTSESNSDLDLEVNMKEYLFLALIESKKPVYIRVR